MTLSVQPSADTQRSWNVASDLLSFLRCGLRYRYTQPGKSRPSHSSRQFSGQFLQQVLEEAWLHFKNAATAPLPWPDQTIRELLDHVEQRLAARQVRCHSATGRHYARLRAAAAVNELGPVLFPLLSHARLQVRNSISAPDMAPADTAPANTTPAHTAISPPSCELTADIHAIAQLQLHDPTLSSNPLVRLLQQQLPQQQLPTAPLGTVQLLVDFQSNTRPDAALPGTRLNDLTELQILATAFLYRTRSPYPVVAGLVCCLSELVPSRRHFLALRKALLRQSDDFSDHFLAPAPDSPDARILRTWRPSTADQVPPLLSFHFRLQRAIRVIPVSPPDQLTAIAQLHDTIRRIQHCQSREQLTGQLLSVWERNPSGTTVCSSCSARTWCPDHSSAFQPVLPGIRQR